jgi:vitamin B12 transporter
MALCNIGFVMINQSSRAFLVFVAFFALLIILLASAKAMAANSDDLNDAAIEEMIVVAHHIPTPAHLVGSSVSVFDTDDFSKRITFNPADLLRMLPSLNVSQTGPLGGLTEVRLRGSESNHTLVLIDGVEANDPANGAAFNLATLAATSIKRIEVLRGPQSARYGSEAIGGVIAITTDVGTTNAGTQPAVNVGLETGSHGFHQGQISASVQRPLGNTQWRNQVSATRALTNGNNASFFGSESDGYRNRSWSANSALYWADDHQLGLSIRQTHGSADGDPQDFAFPATPYSRLGD